MIGRCAISVRRQRIRPSPFRWYASTHPKPKKDLPPPLPPRASSSTNPSPANAKKEYLEVKKRTDEFLKDPQANLKRIQADMDKTKEQLLKVHDKPIWRRIVDRFKAKQHAVINLLAASMAYILAHRLHLKMKDNEELSLEVEREKANNAELRSLLRSLTTEEFSETVASRATQQTSASARSESAETASSWWSSSSGRASSSASSPPPNNALAASLRQALEAKIGDEGLEDADRKKKNIREIWVENEQKKEQTEEGLVELAAVIAAEGDTTKRDSKKRVFDL
jgi:hypothetical protein